MAPGKFIVLLLAGGVGAGLLFATATTAVMRPYRTPVPRGALPPDPHEASGDAYAAPEAPQERPGSWFDHGLSDLEMPAWPFGREQWEGDADQGYARPYRDDPRWAGPAEDYRDDYRSGNEAYYHGSHRDYANDGEDSSSYGDDTRDFPADEPQARTAPRVSAPRNDAAADAASRARDAAADALAAEKGGN